MRHDEQRNRARIEPTRRPWTGMRDMEREGYPPGYAVENLTRGPRGYVRSDERIGEDVYERLTADPDLDASDVELDVLEGEVTLSGTVASRADKRHAEDLASSVYGVRDVHNRLRIDRGRRG